MYAVFTLLNHVSSFLGSHTVVQCTSRHAPLVKHIHTCSQSVEIAAKTQAMITVTYINSYFQTDLWHVKLPYILWVMC